MNRGTIILMAFTIFLAILATFVGWIKYKSSFDFFLTRVKEIQTSKGRNGHKYYIKGSKRHTKQTMKKLHYDEYLKWKKQK